MPVKRVGKQIVEVATGRVVGRGRSKRSAAISAWIRNREHRKKGARRGAVMEKLGRKRDDQE